MVAARVPWAELWALSDRRRGAGCALSTQQVRTLRGREVS